MNIIDVATVINPDLTPLNALQARYQWGERNHKIFSRFLKLESACLFPEETLPQLLKGCLEKLLSRHPDKRGRIRYLAYAHSLNATFPFGADGLRKMAATLLPAQTEVLSATQNSCASSFNALSLLTNLLPGEAEDGPQYAVLLTGEKCFHQTVQYANQNGIFGEGCTALLLTDDDTQPGCTVQGVGQAMIGGIGSRTYQSSASLENRYDHASIRSFMCSPLPAAPGSPKACRSVAIISARFLAGIIACCERRARRRKGISIMPGCRLIWGCWISSPVLP